MKKFLFLCGLMLALLTAASGQPKNIIRGTITDEASGQALAGVTVLLLNSEPPVGATSDEHGRFALPPLPVGRYSLRATFLGYEPAVMRELAVQSAKETVVDIALRESVVKIDAVVVRPKVNKEEPLNAMALAGARMLSVEEANRYAGGFDDPARLVSAFAGVAGSVSSNAIVIRGNAPQFLQWKLEGVEIPNPSHYPELGGVGGGILTALSSQVMGNSDFLAGAFPAEYSNALAGVFDMGLRAGNNERYEHSAQLGTLGIEVASEGPIGKSHRASYLFNYRYSTMSLAGELMGGAMADVAGMKYQDLSFKINVPTRRAGTFSLWGIGTYDRYSTPEDYIDLTSYDYLPSRGLSKQSMAAAGIGHKVFTGRSAYLKTTLAVTYDNNHLWDDRYAPTGEASTFLDMFGSNTGLVLRSYLNAKLSARHTNRTGVALTALRYRTDSWTVPNAPYGPLPMLHFADADGHSALASAFSQSTFQLGQRWTAEAGITALYFALNGRFSVEPRVAIRWQAAPHHALALAYGLHSRHEKLDYYFVEVGGQQVNKSLDFARAHHLVLSYDLHITDNLHFRAEPYFQYLFDVPAEAGGAFCIINQTDFWLDKALTNAGRARNYGIDLTLERYLDRGWYGMITGSLFSSRYAGGDGVWRSTAYNRHFLANALGGKEWMLGARRRHVLGVNLRACLMGGGYHTPPDQAASEAAQRPIFDEARTMSERDKPSFQLHLTVSFKINRERTAHEVAVKLLNLTGSKDYFGYDYNFRTHRVDHIAEAVVLPNVYYRISF